MAPLSWPNGWISVHHPGIRTTTGTFTFERIQVGKQCLAGNDGETRPAKVTERSTPLLTVAHPWWRSKLSFVGGERCVAATHPNKRERVRPT